MTVGQNYYFLARLFLTTCNHVESTVTKMVLRSVLFQSTGFDGETWLAKDFLVGILKLLTSNL